MRTSTTDTTTPEILATPDAAIVGYVVICRDDPSDDAPDGAYTLATRRVFATHASATRYAGSISPSRDPIVVDGRWAGLRFA